MRAILLILIVAVVGLIAAIATGLVNVSQTQQARAPIVKATDGGIRAERGQPPAFEVQTGSVGIGTGEANVPVPTVEVKRDQATVKVPSVEVRRADGGQSNAN